MGCGPVEWLPAAKFEKHTLCFFIFFILAVVTEISVKNGFTL